MLLLLLQAEIDVLPTIITVVGSALHILNNYAKAALYGHRPIDEALFAVYPSRLYTVLSAVIAGLVSAIGTEVSPAPVMPTIVRLATGWAVMDGLDIVKRLAEHSTRGRQLLADDLQQQVLSAVVGPQK